jgi:outer membrane immunogenic protein
MRTLFLGGASIVVLVVVTPVIAARGGDSHGGGSTCTAATRTGCMHAAGAASASAIATKITGSLDPSAVNGAIQAGYNWQVGTLIFGLASDLRWFNLSGMRQVSANYQTSFASNSLFTLRGRLGFTETNLLPYVTGGLALSNFQMADFTDNVGALGAFGGATNSDQLTGWTIGGGLEWAVNDHWTVKGEYLYINLGSMAASSTNPGFVDYSNGPGVSSDLTLHVVHAGMNYKF